MRRTPLLLGAILLFTVATLGLGGCGSDGRDGADGASDGAASPGKDLPGLEMVAPPGIYDLPGGETQVLGILTYRDLEGGFWAVADAADPSQAATAELVAVIVPDGEIAADMGTYEGRYVSVIGSREDGPNIYQAGVVVEGRSIEVVSDTVVE